MSETINMNKIYETLVELKREVDFIKNHMVDVDVVLTPEENIELDESLKELEEGKTFSFEDIKKDREKCLNYNFLLRRKNFLKNLIK